MCPAVPRTSGGASPDAVAAIGAEAYRVAARTAPTAASALASSSVRGSRTSHPSLTRPITGGAAAAHPRRQLVERRRARIARAARPLELEQRQRPAAHAGAGADHLRV